MKLAAIVDALSSRKGGALLAPAILLVGAALAVGQNQLPTPAVAQATTQPAEAPRQAGAAGDTFSPGQRRELESIIKDFLLSNPEVMMEVQNALEAKMEKIQSERTAVAIRQNATEIFRPASSPIVGNTKGDVTVIEFFDYNCPYCKKA